MFWKRAFHTHIYIYLYTLTYIYEEVFSKTWSLNFSLTLQTRFLDWRLSHFGKELFMYIYIIYIVFIYIYSILNIIDMHIYVRHVSVRHTVYTISLVLKSRPASLCGYFEDKAFRGGKETSAWGATVNMRMKWRLDRKQWPTSQSTNCHCLMVPRVTKHQPSQPAEFIDLDVKLFPKDRYYCIFIILYIFIYMLHIVHLCDGYVWLYLAGKWQISIL